MENGMCGERGGWDLRRSEGRREIREEPKEEGRE